MKRPLFVLGLTGLGLLVGFAIFRSESVGYFVRWQKLPVPPSEVDRFVVSREGDLYAGSFEGEALHWDGRSWEVAEAPAGLEQGWSVIHPCRQEMPQFSPLTRPPSGVVDCIQDEGIYAEFYNKHVYALDDQGNVWQWSLLTHALGQVIRLVVYPCIGGIAGLILALAVLVGMRLRGRRS